MILVTGSDGLIGRAVCALLEQAGLPVRRFDIRHDQAQDTRNSDALASAMDGVTGVIHLAAVSRVVWAQQNPELCRSVNVDPLAKLLDLAVASPTRPWLIFASSREVYGDVATLPVDENVPPNPLNTYAVSKVDGERLVATARERGVRASVVRFSNVYGTTADHVDRVVTAFARVAAFGGRLRLDGAESTFDFTHVDDAARGLALAVDVHVAGSSLPPIHFLTGRGTTLAELAAIASRASVKPLPIDLAPPRTFDVARFVGDPSRARQLLGWEPSIDIDGGVARLVESFRANGPEAHSPCFMPMLKGASMSAVHGHKVGLAMGSPSRIGPQEADAR